MSISRATTTGALALATVAALLAGTAPAQAADTTTTFSIAAGGLSISAPATAALGPGIQGNNLSGSLGPVSVTDTRGSLSATWTATVSSTDFVTGGATAEETVPKSAVSYWSGPATSSSGLGLFVPGQLLSLNAVALGTSRTAFTHALAAGNNTATWNPTLVVAVPAAAVTGTYTGTITHSVS